MFYKYIIKKNGWRIVEDIHRHNVWWLGLHHLQGCKYLGEEEQQSDKCIHDSLVLQDVSGASEKETLSEQLRGEGWRYLWYLKSIELYIVQMMLDK